jgi:rhodanese-related sulfurtransferase
MKWKRILGETLALIAVACVFALLANLLAPEAKRLSWFRSAEPEDINPAAIGSSVRNNAAQAERRKALRSIAPAKDPTLLYLEIQGDMARRLHEAGALFIDARRTESYVENHISNSINLSVWGSKVDEDIRGFQREGIPFDDVIVVYCSGADCSDSLALSEKLAIAGYLSIYVYRNGFPEWKRNGWPVTSGKTP